MPSIPGYKTVVANVRYEVVTRVAVDIPDDEPLDDDAVLEAVYGSGELPHDSLDVTVEDWTAA